MNSALPSWQMTENSLFCHSLSNVTLPMPQGLKAWHGQSVEKRFQVYRNNVYSGLLDVLTTQFSVTHQLVGDEFFRDMARIYVKQALPSTPRLFEYGSDFPAFIASFEHAQDLPYLADVARLEWLWTCAYHAAEAEPLTSEAIAMISPEAMSTIAFSFHHSFQMMSSEHPAVSIWAAHQDEMQSLEITPQSEAAIIIRPEAEVMVLPISPNMGAFILALRAGHSLSEALAMGYDEQAPFDISQCLATLIQYGCFTSCHFGDQS